jgi:hypothetical protein
MLIAALLRERAPTDLVNRETARTTIEAWERSLLLRVCAAEGLISTLAFILLGSMVLGLIAFSRQVYQLTHMDVPYTQSGAFRYSAKAPSGIYDAEQIRTGEPIFLQLTDGFHVEFEYDVTAEDLSDVTALYEMTMLAEDPRSPEVDPLRPTESGIVQVPVTQATFVSLLGMGIPVHKLRWISGIAFGVSLLGALAFLLLRTRAGKLEHLAQTEWRYGHLPVGIEDGQALIDEATISLARMDDLAKIAQDKGELIFHQVGGEIHHYFVTADGRTYQAAFRDPPVQGDDAEKGAGDADTAVSAPRGKREKRP